MRLNIIYTSDVHGQITSTNYALNKQETIGLSRLSSYIKKQEKPCLILDNGDFLQGNVILDYYRKHPLNDAHPMIEAFNRIDYDVINLGNHDFNYGQDYLKEVTKPFKGTVLCANIVDQNQQPLFSPYRIKTLTNGKKIGIIGTVTQYIPHWEKPSHISGLTFLNAYETTLNYVRKLRAQVDYLIVLYHGGFEKDLTTSQSIGRQTGENLGYKISTIEGIDLLLCGHQHMPTIHRNQANTLVLQTAANGKNFGHITVDFSAESFTHHAELVDNTMDDDKEFSAQFAELERQTQEYLDQPIAKTMQDMKITSQFLARAKKHPMFQFINNLQRSLTSAQISAASLPNDAIGFSKTIDLRAVAANFVYPNTLQVLKMQGRDIKEALERTAEYFTIKDGKLAMDKSFIHPKKEHYNYDVYDGIEYSFDIRKAKGQRLTQVTIKGAVLEDEKRYTIVVNNYRAQGGGDYPMYEKAQLLKEYTISMFDLVVDYLEKNPVLEIQVVENYKLIIDG